MSDRLKEIQRRWNLAGRIGGHSQFIYAHEDVEWLVAEVEQLREQLNAAAGDFPEPRTP